MNENEIEMQFHTAMFGGFQKQDVLTYLETSAGEYTQKISALQRELDETRQEKGELQSQVEAAEQRFSALEEENRRLLATLHERENSLNERENALEQLIIERDREKARNDEMEDKLRVMAPAAAGYEAIKDRTAGIELEAHGRAQMIENEAKEHARELQHEMDGWCGQLQQVYATLRKDADQAILQARNEIDRVMHDMDNLTAALDTQGVTLDKIRHGVEQVTGPKVPQPIPPEEI